MFKFIIVEIVADSEDKTILDDLNQKMTELKLEHYCVFNILQKNQLDSEELQKTSPILQWRIERENSRSRIAQDNGNKGVEMNK